MPSSGLLRRLLIAPLLAMLLGHATASAERREVLIVPSADAPFYQQTIDALIHRLRERPEPVALRVTDLAGLDAALARVPAPATLVTLGSGAASAVRQRRTGAAVIEALVPRSSRERLARDEASPQPAATLLLDQPIERHLALIRAALPAARRIGVLHAASNPDWLHELEARVRSTGLQLVTEQVEDKSRLITQLDQLLGRIDVLLVTPDPAIYNRQSLKRILLTSYRRRVPLIGLTESYVRAGALAAVHTTAEQYAGELAERIDAVLRGESGATAGPLFPQRYTVDTNPQVARSLNIPLPDPITLQRALSRPTVPAP